MGLLIFVDTLLAALILCDILALLDAIESKSKITIVIVLLLLLALVFVSVEINISVLDFIHSGGFLI